MNATEEEAKRLRAMNISVPDISRQTGLSVFKVYEVTESRDVAVRKMARLHFLRGTGWPWDEKACDPDSQRPPSGDRPLDAARAIIDLLRGTSLDNPIRMALDQLGDDERMQMLEIMRYLIADAAK
ncbi:MULTISPECIES: hypothetical protein [unclassified Agrobacterium]|uniref:hypothetical protein n=1 Tax=unclassified Agrobacterium TaxID=2632611 RepID=UPI00083E06A3|nr:MULTISPECIES: hypothetical protein [unclassified Agrobacterium]QGG90983.1 hypothetical protein GH983_11125 [Agrobacterium sp. MA01]